MPRILLALSLSKLSAFSPAGLQRAGGAGEAPAAPEDQHVGGGDVVQVPPKSSGRGGGGAQSLKPTETGSRGKCGLCHLRFWGDVTGSM